jgi:XTP/dITP diphosphohydrolase
MPQPKNTVIVASNNRGKLAEIIENLDMVGWQFLPLSSLGTAEIPEETGTTYEENARIKTQAVCSPDRPMAALADDSGLEVDALDGAPGIRSARYSGEQATDKDNVVKLLGALEGRPEEERTARFVCCVVYEDGLGHEIVVRGVCEGRIALEPRGEGGFGYDPVFLPDEVGDGRTMAELSPREKDLISHRGKALRALREELLARSAEPSPQPAAPPQQPTDKTSTPSSPVRIVAFDLDGTLLEGHSPVLMLRHLFRQGIIRYSVALQVLWWGVRYRLRMPVEQKTVRGLIFRSFSCFPAAEIDSRMADVYREGVKPRLRPLGLEAIRKHREAGEVVVLVSASFTPILTEVSRDVGADWFICTRMEVKDGRYTGNVVGQPPEGAQKLIQLTAWADAAYQQGGWELVAAYGDHRSDEPMLAAAREPVAVNPDTGLERAAKREGWRILDWSFPLPPDEEKTGENPA